MTDADKLFHEQWLGTVQPSEGLGELSGQVFEALEVLLGGFSAADERDGTALLRGALERDDEHLYGGLLAVSLRLVFLLHCEERAVLPVEHPVFQESYSLLGLFDQLQSDHGRSPDTMHQRFGAYPRLVSLFRAVFFGVTQGELELPARRGDLFDPNAYPFLEGWGPEDSAPDMQPEERAPVKLPSVDDLTVYTALRKLLYVDGQRLSYKALDVEHIGSVFEALMGFTVQRLESSAVRIKQGSKKGSPREWVEAERLLALPKNQRASWLQDDLGFDKAVTAKIVEAVAPARSAEKVLAALESLSGRHAERAAPGTLVLRPAPERRRTSGHYTPRALTEPIVAGTLEPLLKAMGDTPSSDALLNLVICDPAMGSGAFLVAACRYLADHVVAAWAREGKVEKLAHAHDDVVNHARRLVAQRCLYGVDKNRHAVQLARLSLWLLTMASSEPFTFVDHALRHGDSLVGLNIAQLRAFHWKPAAPVEVSAVLMNDALDEATKIRQKLLELAAKGTPLAQREKERLLSSAANALDRVRLLGDLVIGAFFGKSKDKDRQKERDRRLALVEQWIAAEKQGDRARAGEVESELRSLQAELKRTQVPFHWMVEFPEVFHAERPDPLEQPLANGAGGRGIHAMLGNLPFLGGRRIATVHGDSYADWLTGTYSGTGDTDYVGYLLLRAAELSAPSAGLGLIATNAIAEGDNRRTVLCPMLESHALELYRAETGFPWPGSAMVLVALLEFAKGTVRNHLPPRVLNGRVVPRISSRLRGTAEWPDPKPIPANKGLALVGCFLRGEGFVLEPEEARALLRDHPEESPVVRPFLVGADLNFTPDQQARRWVIDFADRSLDEAKAFPAALRIVQERVKPGRDRLKATGADADHRRYWWRFANVRKELRERAAGLTRMLATARVSKHTMLAFVPPDWVPSEQVVVFPMVSWTAYAVLQSRVHGAWVRLNATHMGAGIRYSASECFETFPFPKLDPAAVLPGLEVAGQRAYEARAALMTQAGCGMTWVHNELADPQCADPAVRRLRAVYEALDCAVVAAYGWQGVPVPPYCPATELERIAFQAFEDTVVDRLSELNAASLPPASAVAKKR